MSELSRAFEFMQSQQAKIDSLQKENDRLNIWYKNVKLQLENKQIDCDRSDREVDELQKKHDAMYNAFIVVDDCRKEWHESYMSARKECDELQARIDKADSLIMSFGDDIDVPLRNALIDAVRGLEDI